MSTDPEPMPSRRSQNALRFNIADPASLWTYFIDYETLAEAAQLEETKKIQQSVIYLDRDEADFWESLDEYSGNDWLAFKNAIFSFYPGSVPKDRWSLDDLDELCKAQKA